MFEEFFWRNLQEPQAHSCKNINTTIDSNYPNNHPIFCTFDVLHGVQVAARCEQFEGGVEGDPGLVIEGDPGLVRQDMQSSWEGLPAGEGLNIVQIKPDHTIISTCKSGSKRHIILIKVSKKCVYVKSQNDYSNRSNLAMTWKETKQLVGEDSRPALSFSSLWF